MNILQGHKSKIAYDSIGLLVAVIYGDLNPQITDEQAVSDYLTSQSDFHFDIIYRRFADKVYRKCFLMLRNEALATDATQDIFIKIFNNLNSFTSQARLSTWIYTITYNHCIDYIRVHKKRHTSDIDESFDLSDEEDDARVDKEIMEMELDKIEQIFEHVQPDEKAILLMKYIDGMSIKEIALAYNKNESAIKMKIMRAKEKVRLHYKKMFSNERRK